MMYRNLSLFDYYLPVLYGLSILLFVFIIDYFHHRDSLLFSYLSVIIIDFLLL